MKEEELKQLQQKALSQFKSGQSLFGKDGAFAPLLKQFLDAALDAEMEEHLDESERERGNKRNGRGKKTIKSSSGSFEIETPQDRLSSFTPDIIRKRETILAESLEEKIIGMYGMGMSMRDISSHIADMYDTQISHTVISEITDRIIPKVKEWQNRPLEGLYCIVWLDCMHYKVKVEGKVESRALYNILGVNQEGQKEILGMYVAESEGSRFWLNVLTHLQQRGLKDILIACIDNLNGFSEAIAAIFPHTRIQSCIVHQIRNSLKYVPSKQQKDFLTDLKQVYQAQTLELAELRLEEFSASWESKYPIVVRSWQQNWHKLSTYFDYTEDIRRMIYTTNSIEGLHRQIRKITKPKGAFPNDMALLKLAYLATRRVEKKWTAPLQNWRLIIQQLSITFDDRITPHLPITSPGLAPAK